MNLKNLFAKQEKKEEVLDFESLPQIWNEYSAGCYWFLGLKCFKDVWKIIEGMLFPCFGGIVLDGGCGTGGMFRPILEKMKPEKIIAVDWSEKMLEKAKEVGMKLEKDFQKQIFEFDKVDLTKTFPWADNTFDAAIFNLVLNYLPQQKRISAVKEAYRVIKPGGYIYASVQLKGWDFPNMIKKKMLEELIHNPIACFRAAKIKKGARKIQECAEKGIIEFPTKKEFVDLLESSGFGNIEEKGIFDNTGTIIRARKI